MPSATPLTAAIPAVLRRCRGDDISARSLSVSANLHTSAIRRWEAGTAPRFDGLERALDVLDLPFSTFVKELEAASQGRPLTPLPVLTMLCRPSQSWQQAVAQSVACLAVDRFGGGLLLYDGRWAAVRPDSSGRVRLDLVRGREDELAALGKLLRS